MDFSNNCAGARLGTVERLVRMARFEDTSNYQVDHLMTWWDSWPVDNELLNLDHHNSLTWIFVFTGKCHCRVVKSSLPTRFYWKLTDIDKNSHYLKPFTWPGTPKGVESKICRRDHAGCVTVTYQLCSILESVSSRIELISLVALHDDLHSGLT